MKAFHTGFSVDCYLNIKLKVLTFSFKGLSGVHIQYILGKQGTVAFFIHIWSLQSLPAQEDNDRTTTPTQFTECRCKHPPIKAKSQHFSQIVIVSLQIQFAEVQSKHKEKNVRRGEIVFHICCFESVINAKEYSSSSYIPT